MQSSRLSQRSSRCAHNIFFHFHFFSLYILFEHFITAQLTCGIFIYVQCKRRPYEYERSLKSLVNGL